MTSIERTAYPRLKRTITAQEIHAAFTPRAEEIAWAREKTRSDAHVLALVLLLKCYQRVGHFLALAEVPAGIIVHVRGCLDLGGQVLPTPESDRSGHRHREFVRERLAVVYDPGRARAVAEVAIRAAAGIKNNPPDLINIALEELLRARHELPAFSTLDRMAGEIRAAVNRDIFATVEARLQPADRERLTALLAVDERRKRSAFDWLKQPAPKATWSKFRAQLVRLAWVDSLGPTDVWLAGVAPSKIADFAGEAAAADVGVMQDMAGRKRIALLVCLVQTARVRTRDDVADMFCKRMATSVQHAKTTLAELQERHKALSEHLIASYKDVLEALAAPGEGPGTEEAAGRLARSVVAAAGGFGAQLADIEAVSAYHGDNAVPLVERFYRPNRSAILQLVRTLDLQATSADRSVLEALDHVVAHAHLTRDHIPDHRNGRVVATSFASEQWQRVIRARNHPGQLVRRHFEPCVFVYLMEELRSGDVAVRGSAAYANWQDNLLPWEACTPLLAEFCAEVELPADAPGFIAALRTKLTEGAAMVDAGYPDNADLVIDAATGVLTLKRRRGQERRPAALALEEAIKERLPERSLLEILARTAYWLGWWRRFGPASGADPKLADPLLRYVLCTFTFGCNLGPYQAARHMAGVSAHELSATANRHVTVAKLNQAITDVINGFARLDLPKAWGDGSAVAADGTQVDTFIDNLLAEIHIRYGGHGGIAYHHVADTYIALFSHFIPCGVWEAVYIIEGLLQNKSDVQPDTIHADTQGQSFPVFGLAHVLGFELLPRIRNWKDLIFYRPSPQARYTHIDPLFGDAVIDWKLIETHWRDLMQVAMSIKAGRINSALLLRRLGNNSRKNNIYKAFRELGRAVRTLVLLRFISEPELREGMTAATNKVEAYNGYSKWLRFGNEGVIANNDPDEQEKVIKFNDLVANCVIFHTTIDMMSVLRALRQEGWVMATADLAVISPYIREGVKRFGEYAVDGLGTPPEAFDPSLPFDDAA